MAPFKESSLFLKIHSEASQEATSSYFDVFQNFFDSLKIFLTYLCLLLLCGLRMQKLHKVIKMLFWLRTVGGFPRISSTYSMMKMSSSPSLLKARAGIAQMSEKLKTDSISVFML